MKNLFLAMIVTAFFCSCQSAQKPAEETKQDLTVADSVVPEVPKPADPDPTDSIAPEQYQANASSMQTAELVRSFLQGSMKDDLSKNLVDSFSRKFVFFEHDLNDDGSKEILVGLRGPYFCGTGGCTIYILNGKGEKISNFTVADYPVVIDNTVTKGYHDLLIQSKGTWHLIKFDGTRYPSNVSMQPKAKVIPGDGLPRALNFMNEPYPWFNF